MSFGQNFNRGNIYGERGQLGRGFTRAGDRGNKGQGQGQGTFASPPVSQPSQQGTFTASATVTDPASPMFMADNPLVNEANTRQQFGNTAGTNAPALGARSNVIRRI